MKTKSQPFLIYDSPRVSKGRNHGYLVSSIKKGSEQEIRDYSEKARKGLKGDYLMAHREVPQENQRRKGDEYLILARFPSNRKDISNIKKEINKILEGLPSPDPKNGVTSQGVIYECADLLKPEEAIRNLMVNHMPKKKSRTILIIAFLGVAVALALVFILFSSLFGNQEDSSNSQTEVIAAKKSEWHALKDGSDPALSTFAAWTGLPENWNGDSQVAQDWARDVLEKLVPEPNFEDSESYASFVKNEDVNKILDDIKRKEEPDPVEISKEYLSELELNGRRKKFIDNFIKNINSSPFKTAAEYREHNNFSKDNFKLYNLDDLDEFSNLGS